MAGEWHKGLNARVCEMELVRIAVDAIAISYPPTLPSFGASGGSQVLLLLARGTVNARPYAATSALDPIIRKLLAILKMT